MPQESLLSSMALWSQVLLFFSFNREGEDSSIGISRRQVSMKMDRWQVGPVPSINAPTGTDPRAVSIGVHGVACPWTPLWSGIRVVPSGLSHAMPAPLKDWKDGNGALRNYEKINSDSLFYLPVFSTNYRWIVGTGLGNLQAMGEWCGSSWK
jgi:hypothetical protein